MEKELFKMTQKELDRYEVIRKLIAKEITPGDAAKQLGRSVRQVKRLRNKVREKGANGIIHGLRGKQSNNKTDLKIWEKSGQIISEKYPDFGPTLAHEKLVEVEGIKIGKQTTRNLMIAKKIWMPKPRKQNQEFRCQRERKESPGELEQFDGCYHFWFEKRGDESCLLASVDDATGRITRAEFTDSESVINVFQFWKGYLQESGKPIAIYLDKFSTYKINHKNAKDNSEMITQFQRAARELDITLITANSPQAKGRIERLFDTLQDRLVKELRLRGISDIAAASKFLKEEFIPDFNQRFSVIPKKKNDLHRQLPDFQSSNLDAIFSVQSQRRVQNDFTIRFKNQWIQIAKEQIATVRRKDEILMEERLDGSLAIRLRDKYLNFKILPAKPLKAKELIAAIPAKRIISKPPADHPWRKQIAAEIAKINC
ncbi:MAG: ISNCY family transposase [Candidatus Nealsonbacteria bacterium DGGOD1a]|jgi:Integrase core domain.|nr:MAG: ISNCY family transposase [Candidatus Nealsonbacteria bacterium DGGOD1a]UMX47854.1 MAG: ISNCY family transposase [Candidatus Nealsonbacteria bacterium DGGOD1a]UMX48082.1 MAG: ISNCY family transposase [Candidatus Nealsonbacteria bacterium DGGOD1a]